MLAHVHLADDVVAGSSCNGVEYRKIRAVPEMERMVAHDCRASLLYARKTKFTDTVALPSMIAEQPTGDAA